MTDKFDPGSGVTPPTTTPGDNRLGASVSIKDSTGRLAKNIELDPTTGRGTYTRTMGAGDLGVRTMNSSFTGKPGTEASFTQHVYDANGNLQGSLAGTVDQVVAGPGIYVSSPNGQGVVTISTSPMPTSPNNETLYDISWSQVTSQKPFGAVGQFIAVGVGGVNMRSRDGVNWVQMASSGQMMVGGSAELNANIPGFVEYTGVGPNGTSVYGHLGLNGDAMTTVQQLSDQNGLITERFISTLIFATTATTYVPGGGGTTSSNFTINSVYLAAGSSTTPATAFNLSDYININWTATTTNPTAYPTGYDPYYKIIIDGVYVVNGTKNGTGTSPNWSYFEYIGDNGFSSYGSVPLGAGSHTVVIEFWDGSVGAPNSTFVSSHTLPFTVS